MCDKIRLQKEKEVTKIMTNTEAHANEKFAYLVLFSNIYYFSINITS